MKTDPATRTEFKAGDNVILTGGPSQGTPGVFVRLMEGDAQWAEIKEQNDAVRNHPLVWLRSFPFLPGSPLAPQILLALANADGCA